MSQVLITGGTGLVGSQLLKKFDDVVITSRDLTRARTQLQRPDLDVIEWDYRQNKPKFGGRNISAFINLMGESVAEGRWTDEKKKRLLESRVKTTMQLVDAIDQMNTKPDVMVSASAVGYYDDCGDEFIDEQGARGSGFLAELAEQWEAAAEKVQSMGVRLVILRIGVVLSGQGGALSKMLPIFKTGLGGKLGNGKQYFPWIHIDDLVSMVCWSIRNSQVNGVVNATAPATVTNAEFTKVLAKILRRPAFLPVPKFGLKIAFGEFAETLFCSQRVVPKVALNHGFQFEFPELDEALEDLIA